MYLILCCADLVQDALRCVGRLDDRSSEENRDEEDSGMPSYQELPDEKSEDNEMKTTANGAEEDDSAQM